MQKTLPSSPSDFLAFEAKPVDIVRDQMQLGNTASVPCQLHLISCRLRKLRWKRVFTGVHELRDAFGRELF
jgi:hypothetical protein